MRGYPLRLALTTRQVTDVVMFDAEILSVKLGRQVKDDQDEPMVHIPVCAGICGACSSNP